MSIRITAWKEIFGFECMRKKGTYSTRVILFKKWFTWKCKPSKKINRGRVKERHLLKREKGKKWKSYRCVTGCASRRIPGLLKWIFSVIKFKSVYIGANGCTRDPAVTGLMFGFVQALESFNGEVVQTSFIPDFSKREIEGSVSIILNIILLVLFCGLLRHGILFCCQYIKCITKLRGGCIWLLKN